MTILDRGFPGSQLTSFPETPGLRTPAGRPGLEATPRGCPCDHCSPDRGQTLTFADEALDVEILVLDPQHLPLAHVPTGVTQDRRAGRLLQGAVTSLGLRHCQNKRSHIKGRLCRAEGEQTSQVQRRPRTQHKSQRTSRDRLIFSSGTSEKRMMDRPAGQPPVRAPVCASPSRCANLSPSLYAQQQ